MNLPNLWPLWGIGWLFMPRMTIGFLIYNFFPNYPTLGITLAIIGGIIDLTTESSN